MDFSQLSFEDFAKAFADMTAKDFCETLRKEMGIELPPLAKKADTLRAGYEAIKASQVPANPAPAVDPPAPAAATSDGAGEARRVLVRSRTGRSRWRDGRAFPGDKFDTVLESEITDAQRADPYLEIREIK